MPTATAFRHSRHEPARARPRRWSAPAGPGIDAAWSVVLGAFLVTMVGYGAIYSYAAFAEDIAASFGASRTAVAFVYALSGGTCFLVSALTGRLADRVGARLLAILGMGLVGLGFLMAAAAESMVEVYLGYGLLIGLGTGCAYVPAIALVQAWFRAHRGLASGLAVSGIGVGTALVPATVSALAGLGDWRVAFTGCAALCVGIGLLGAGLLQPAPLAEAIPAQRPAGPVMRSRGFLLAYLGTVLVAFPAALPHALLVSTAQDLGLPRSEALSLLGLIGVGTIVGRLVLAALADQLGRATVFLLCCAGMSVSMLAWCAGPDPAALMGFALAFGALQGGYVALLPAFAADRFGPGRLGAVIGTLYTGRGVALMAAPPAVAAGFSALGGPVAPLLAVAGLGLVGTLLLSAARRAA